MATIGNRKPCVIIESPYAGDIEGNVEFARRCVRDCVLRGEAPIASHLLFTQPGILKDEDPEERQLGIDCGLAWAGVADYFVFYTDKGWSRGMLAALHKIMIQGYRGPNFRIRSLDKNPELPTALHEEVQRRLEEAVDLTKA